MRFKMIFELENSKLNIQYRKSIISWIKNAIEEYDKELYLQMYKDKEPIKKSFCFAPILSNPKFFKEEIEMSNNDLQIIFSIYNYAYALHIYNSFLNQKNRKFSLNKNSMILKKIIMIPEKNINSNEILIKMKSPIITRNHDRETLKDLYYCYERKEFLEYLKINILEQIKSEGLDSNLLEGFNIEPLNAKKTVMPLYEKMIEMSLGTFRVYGNPKLLNYLYRSGMSAKKAMGFRII